MLDMLDKTDAAEGIHINIINESRRCMICNYY